jgi:MFS family permease
MFFFFEAITMLMGGVFCRYITSGWVYIFLLTGIFGFIWFPLWLLLVADSPQTHRTISEKERNYICHLIGTDVNAKTTKPPPLPWKKAIRSKPIIALLTTQFCCLFGLFFFYTNVGKILTEIHHVPTQTAGYVLAGGFLLMPICSLSTGIIADRLVRAKKISLTNVRKLFNSLTAFIPAGCMIVLCFCDHTRQILGVITVLIFLAGSGKL